MQFLHAADGWRSFSAASNLRAKSVKVGSRAPSTSIISPGWAAAAISKATKAVAIAVSQSDGTIRVFVDGEPKIRIESRHNAEGQQYPTVWHDAK